MRKQLLVLSTLSVLFLTACNSKSLSKDETKNYCKENYTIEKAQATYKSGKVHNVIDVQKSEGSLKDVFPVNKEESDSDITSSDFDDYLMSESKIDDLPGDSLYTLKDGCILITSKMSVEEALNDTNDSSTKEGTEYSGTGVVITMITNDVGLIVDQAVTIDIGYSTIIDGEKVSESLLMAITATVSYTA